MQCLQLYLKDSTRAWLRGLPQGSIRSWEDLVGDSVKNFQATYKRPVGIEELRQCHQKPKELMRSNIGRFNKLLNTVEDVSVDREIDNFSDCIRRESYIEELACKKPKTITKLMEIANSWADGEGHVRKSRLRNDDEEDDRKHPNDLSSRRDRRKKRRDRGYEMFSGTINVRLITMIDTMANMMTDTVNDVTIAGITIATDLEAVEVAGGTALRGYLIFHLRS
jgi:hypothetical protein